MNEKNIFERQEKKIENLSTKLTTAKDSILKLNNNLFDLNYFTLQGNENAMSYFENIGYEAKSVEQMVSDNIYDQNLIKGNNPIIPYEGINGDLKINKIKFLNHKWVIADYTDGSYWGEMLLEYYIDEKNNLTLSNLGALMYVSN